MVYRPINGKLKVGMRCGEHGKSAVEEAGKTMQHAKRMTRGARIRKNYFPKIVYSRGERGDTPKSTLISDLLGVEISCRHSLAEVKQPTERPDLMRIVGRGAEAIASGENPQFWRATFLSWRRHAIDADPHA